MFVLQATMKFRFNSIVSVLWFCIITTPVWAQNEIIDSLQLLIKSETNDSLLYKHLFALVRETEKFSPSSAIEVSRDLYRVAIRMDDLKKKGQASQLLGRFFLATDQNDSSLFYLFKSNDYYAGTSDSLQSIRNNSNVALIYQRTNQYELASNMYIGIIELAESVGNFYSAAVASINQASLLMAQELDQRAIPYLHNVQTYYQQISRSDSRTLNNFKNLMPNVYINLGQAYEVLSGKDIATATYQDSAIYYFNKTIDDAKQLDNAFTSAYLSAYAYNSLGNLWRAQAEKNLEQSDDKGRTMLRESAGHYINALEAFEAIEDKRGMVISSNNLGAIYSKLNQPGRALDYFKKALQVAEEIDFIEEKTSIYNNLAHNYKSLGDFESAFFSLEKHLILNDSLKNAERMSILQELDTKYQTAQKDKEIAELALLNEQKERRQQQQLILFLSITGTLIFVGLLGWARYRYNVQKKKAQYEKEINTAMSRFVPQEFLAAIGRHHILDVELGDNRENDVTIVFTDIRGYTTRTESSTPSQIFQFVKDYMGVVGPVIRKHNGMINQYLGDGVMAIFQNSPEDALKSCIEMQGVINQYNQELVAKGEIPVKVGMGIHSGPLIMGIIGDETRRDATVIADTVNTAARMESITKEYGADILVSSESLGKMENPDHYLFRALGKVSVKGKDTQIEIFECYDIDNEEQKLAKSEFKPVFEQAVSYIQKGEYSPALNLLDKVIETTPGDKAAQYFKSLAEKKLQETVLP